MSEPGDSALDPDSLESVAQYEVGAHSVTIGRRGNWWYVAVDGAALRGRFATPASAWTAGVRRADELDRERST